jgi:formylmethanofuran dehydrogenase subunit C
MPLILTPRTSSSAPLAIDLAGIVPERVAPLERAQIARLPVRADGHACELGELFDAEGDATDLAIECRGDFSRVHRVAAGMTSGVMRIAGGVGRHAGEAMEGGRLEITGDADDWLACELAGGDVRVDGSAGDNVAAALPGSRVGMRGGRVIVAGSVGHLVASRLRRGVVAVGGGCGEGAGFEMRAGTVLIGGAVGNQPGLGMRRGSVIALTDCPRPPATFRRGAAWRPPFLSLLLRSLSAAGFAPTMAVFPENWRQWHGDTLAGGRGELLHPA